MKKINAYDEFFPLVSLIIRLFSIVLIIIPFNCLGQEECFLYSEVSYLSDSIGNRYPGSPGDESSKNHIKKLFSEYGLKCELQSFPIVESQWSEGTLQLITNDSVFDFASGNDFVVSSRSAVDSLSADYVILFGNLLDSLYNNVLNKVVICMTDSSSNTVSYSPSVNSLAQAGALAVIYVLPSKKWTTNNITKGNRSFKQFSIPVIYLNSAVIDYLFPQKAALNKCLLSPPNKKIRLSTQHFNKCLQTSNVIGVKKGSCNQYIVIGAHYDTVAPDLETGEPKRGANDNASGVAIVLSLAKHFQTIPTKNSLVFIAFGGEEKGALGSRHFIQQMPFDKDRITEMINIDMVGKMHNNTLYYKQFNRCRITPSTIHPNTIVLNKGHDGFSDHYDFVKLGIPASYFHTGEDSFNHSTLDTSDRLDYLGMNAILSYLIDYIIAVDSD